MILATRHLEYYEHQGICLTMIMLTRVPLQNPVPTQKPLVPLMEEHSSKQEIQQPISKSHQQP